MAPVLVADSKYQFVPPHEGRFWPRLLACLAPVYLRRTYLVTDIEIRGEDVIRDLRKAGHGILHVFKGDIEATAGAMLTTIEQRLSWRPLEGHDLVERIYRVGNALLSLKEQEYLGHSFPGEPAERVNRLIDGVLAPIETEWLHGTKEGSVVARVKEIRRAILAAMVEGNLSSEELDRRWRQLTDASFAQSLGQYPARYVASRPTVDRILETVERFNEHLCGDETPHGPMKAILTVGEPIEVSPKRDRSAKVDPLLQAIEQSLAGLLEKTAGECAMYKTVGPPAK